MESLIYRFSYRTDLRTPNWERMIWQYHKYKETKIYLNYQKGKSPEYLGVTLHTMCVTINNATMAAPNVVSLFSELSALVNCEAVH